MNSLDFILSPGPRMVFYIFTQTGSVEMGLEGARWKARRPGRRLHGGQNEGGASCKGLLDIFLT